MKLKNYKLQNILNALELRIKKLQSYQGKANPFINLPETKASSGVEVVSERWFTYKKSKYQENFLSMFLRKNFIRSRMTDSVTTYTTNSGKAFIKVK